MNCFTKLNQMMNASPMDIVHLNSHRFSEERGLTKTKTHSIIYILYSIQHRLTSDSKKISIYFVLIKYFIIIILVWNLWLEPFTGVAVPSTKTLWYCGDILFSESDIIVKLQEKDQMKTKMNFCCVRISTSFICGQLISSGQRWIIRRISLRSPVTAP